MFKFSLSILSAVLLASPVSAATKIPQTHRNLLQAIEDVGGYSYVNNNYFCGEADAPDGLYTWNDRGETALVVCQDNATTEQEVVWTLNDLDTLRHEAWHMVQDCLFDSRGDSNLSPLSYSEEYVQLLVSTAQDVLGVERVKSIIVTYTENGADPNTVLMEIEAFLVAATTDPDIIANKLRNSCGV